MRTTSAAAAPASARAARMISRQRRVCTAGSGSHDPSGQIGAVPETKTWGPTRRARENPMADSNGDPEETSCRSIAGC